MGLNTSLYWDGIWYPYLDIKYSYLDFDGYKFHYN